MHPQLRAAGNDASTTARQLSRVVRSVRGGLAAGLLALLLGLALAPPSARAAPVAPSGFFGVVPQGELTARDFDRMRGLGLTVRVPFLWLAIEPHRGEFDFSETDRLASEAARTGVQLLPMLYGTPAWLASDHARPPLGPAGRRAWAGFVRQMVGRYGRGGEFWRGRSPRLPVRSWQVWNEPNFVVFWRPRPSPRGYARLLDISARAIRGADPRALVVAAGVAPVEGDPWPWEYLRRLYRVPGAKRDFDLAALHPYANTLSGVEYAVRATRRVMARAGDGRKPLLLSEIGVASDGRFSNPYDHGRRGQARFLTRVYSLLLAERRRWRIAGAGWFTWRDGSRPDGYCVFCEFAGLFDAAGKPKPSWWAFRRAASAALR